MKKKFLLSAILTIALLAVVVIAVSSMRFANVDAPWGLVDENSTRTREVGAECLRYADGPESGVLNPDATDQSFLIRTGVPGVQGTDTSGWNQVRYGRPGIYLTPGSGWNGSDCEPYYQEYLLDPKIYEPTSTVFHYQSGIAFDGVDSMSGDYGLQTPFPVGKLCHINNQVAVNNDFNNVTANLKFYGVQCAPGETLVNALGTPIPEGSINLDYPYNIEFDETTNSGDCEYTSPYQPIQTPCPDAIIPGQLPANSFYCKAANSDIILEYNVALLGYIPVDENASCVGTEFDEDEIRGVFISDENSVNCACLWAQVQDFIPSAVEMNFFNAEGGTEKIVLRWQTALETDNIGFNIYRSTNAIFEDAEKLNPTLIESLVPAGSTYGADYQFVDDTANPYTRYYYWLEDVDINGTTTLHGPRNAEWVE